jgi:hypothetical protein
VASAADARPARPGGRGLASKRGRRGVRRTRCRSLPRRQCRPAADTPHLQASPSTATYSVVFTPEAEEALADTAREKTSVIQRPGQQRRAGSPAPNKPKPPERLPSGRLVPRMLHERPLSLGKRPPTCGVSGGRYWVRTSDLFGVNEARYHCANRPWCCAGKVSARSRRVHIPGRSGIQPVKRWSQSHPVTAGRGQS